MAPRAVVCELCGGKFFRHSLAHHQKICRERVGVQVHECPYCHAGVPMLGMDAHIARCPEARSAGAQPTGASAVLAARLTKNRERGQGGVDDDVDRPLGASGGDMPAEFADDDADGRIPCQICGRMFAMDRVGKHQAICQKLSSKAPRKTFELQRSYCEGGSDGRTIGYARSSASRAPAAAPEKKKSNWRKESEDFRAAMKAAREFPMPRWGDPGTNHGRHSSTSPGRSTAFRTPQGLRRGAPASSGSPKSERIRSTASRNQPELRPSLSPVKTRPVSQGGQPSTRARTAGSQANTTEATGVRQLPPACSTDVSENSAMMADASFDADDIAASSGAFVDRERADQLKAQFAKRDLNKDGMLDFQELVGLLRAGNPRMSDRNVKLLFDSIDQDANGRIDFDEFVDYVHQVDSVHNSLMPDASAAAKAGVDPSKFRHSPAPAASTERTAAVGSPKSSVRRRGPTSPGPSRPLRSTGRSSTPAASLPEWGSNASSRYGRDCMTAPPSRTTPHNTSWGGCDAPASHQEKTGFESNQCSVGNPLNPSSRYDFSGRHR